MSVDLNELEENSFKSATVEKEDYLIYDLGNLAALDNHQLDPEAHNNDIEKFLHEYNRDNTQLLINKLFKLPSIKDEVGALALLPNPITVIPREKPLPKEKVVTKWEEFKKAKGIHTRKKDKLVWDETHKEYRRSYGYKKANDTINDTWVIDAKPGGSLNPFEDLSNKKKQRIEKQNIAEKKNQLRGVSKNDKGNSISSAPSREKLKQDISTALSIVRKSSASMGKFDKQLPKEDPISKGIKRKFEATAPPDLSDEKES